jgi:serine/threonine protein kinase
LLKRLSHPNIVRFFGYEKTESQLSIMLEYCESGSLYDTMSTFGKFSEPLVRNFISQVLLGLEYLHAEGIIHRDVKSANILCTKDGIIKLADFGIATAIENTKGVFEGSPYWVAPEVIELSGSSSASDIWSVGCTAIELLTGFPPYYHLEPVSALFRIATDESVPYPEGISALFSSFLNECFQKDKNLRIDASRLLKNAWIIVECVTVYNPLSESSKSQVDFEKFRDTSSSHFSDGFGEDLDLRTLCLTERSAVDNEDLGTEIIFQNIHNIAPVIAQQNNQELLFSLHKFNRFQLLDFLIQVVHVNPSN